MNDLSNMPTVDLTSCDREPIHIPGRIQSFGYLLSVTGDWIINHASQNVVDAFGKPSSELLGLPLVDLISQNAVHELRNRMQLLNTQDAVERVFGLDVMSNGELFDVAIHVSGRSIVLEFERSTASSSTDYVGHVRPLIERLQKATTVEALCRTAAKQLKALIGFDRVMVYRFGEDGSGEVVTEARNADMEAFEGLRYPATDIPKQARAMYKRNLLRILSDVGDAGLAIEPTIGPDGAPLDLSLSTTRAVSPIHLEYLRNMGVQASMSISIMQRGELWGLFACHHNTPRVLGYDARTAAELFAQLFSFVLDQKESDAAREDMIKARILHDRIMVRLADGASVSDSLDMITGSIAEVIPFDGAASWIDGEYTAIGRAPTLEQFKPLARFLNTAAVSQVFVTDQLSCIHPPAEDYMNIASGIMALPISRSPRDYLVLFRKELVQSVTWAGDPDKPAIAGPNGIRLTPRKSFEAWQQTVYGHSAPWTQAERRAAESLRMTLLEIVLRLTDASNKERARSQEQQELLIAELNHRVRNILNLIRGLVSQSADAADVSTFIDVIGGRIQALARAHDQITKENWTPASIYELIMTEAQAYLGDDSSRVRVSGTDALLSPAAFTTVSLVIHELMTNSAKYGSLTDHHGHVEIALSELPNGSLRIAWSEHGGPPVSPPVRKGFGSTIIERSIPYELKGRADVVFEVSGLQAAFEIPPSFIKAYQPITAGEAEVSVVPKTVTLSGTALVVEDNMIIALDAEDILSELGASRVLTASSVAAALRLVGEKAIDFAILDVNLGAETSEVVAIELQSKGVPFIFATGYGERTQLSERFPGVAVAQKPYSKESIEALLAKAGK